MFGQNSLNVRDYHCVKSYVSYFSPLGTDSVHWLMKNHNAKINPIKVLSLRNLLRNYDKSEVDRYC